MCMLEGKQWPDDSGEVKPFLTNLSVSCLASDLRWKNHPGSAMWHMKQLSPLFSLSEGVFEKHHYTQTSCASQDVITWDVEQLSYRVPMLVFKAKTVDSSCYLFTFPKSLPGFQRVFFHVTSVKAWELVSTVPISISQYRRIAGFLAQQICCVTLWHHTL